MCDPVTASVVGGGLLASGWATNNQTKSYNRNLRAMQNAKESAYNSSMDRQDAFADESRNLFNNNLNTQGRTGFDQQLQSSAYNRLKAFNDIMIDDGDYNLPASTPKNVILAREKTFNDAKVKQNLKNEALARLSGYGDVNVNQGLSRNNFTRNFGNILDKAAGDIRILPLEMQQAVNNTYKPPNSMLSLVKTGGKLATMMGNPFSGGQSSISSGGQSSPWANPDNIYFGQVDPNLPWKIGGYK